MGDQIKIDKIIWDPLSDSDKKRITEIMKAVGLLPEGVSLVADTQIHAEGWDPINDIKKAACKVACDAALSAGVTACGTYAPAAVPACLLAAQKVHEYCQDHC